MSSKVFPETQADLPPEKHLLGPEVVGGPSVMQDDEPTLARTLAMIGGAFVIFGGMALGFNLFGMGARVSTGWALLTLAVGVGCLLFHASFDRDVQLRRLYMAFGIAVIVLGLVLCVVPYPNKAGDQFRWAFPCLLLGLLFLVAFLRNEDDPRIRDITQKILGGIGLALAVAGLLGGNLKVEFFLPMGLVLGMVGLLYVTAFVGSRGISDDLGFYAALALAGLGTLVVLITLSRSVFPAEGYRYFVQAGFIFLVVGLLYVAVGAGLSLDWPLFVLTRRELGAFFLSPIAYLMLLAFALISWMQYWRFVSQLFTAAEAQGRGGVMPEPIVAFYIFDLFPVFVSVFLPPLLTMRLLSEEQRSGTMEVLLTAPVDETVVVLSKFLAGLLSFLFVWIPFGLFLIAIPLAGGSPFDYRPLLSFFITLVATGAGFIAMGLFFSSVTKNQIASGVLTLAGMLGLTMMHLLPQMFQDERIRKVLAHLSYLTLWNETLEGKIVLQYLLFFPSLAILSLFLTIKVVESRKWR